MERYNYKGKEIIGIDHGFGNIKCRHVAFRSGVRAYDSEPPMTADVLIFGGKYYVVGEEHKGFVSDKSQDEDYYILTVAALARELEFRHITECEAVLAVGLPIQWIGAQKESFRKYLMRNELIEFRYHEQDYLVRIDDVQIFPQGFAGVVQRLGDFKGLNVLADIGNGTMNTLMLKDGKPMLSRCYTDKLGVEQCIIRMSNELLACEKETLSCRRSTRPSCRGLQRNTLILSSQSCGSTSSTRRSCGSPSWAAGPASSNTSGAGMTTASGISRTSALRPRATSCWR